MSDEWGSVTVKGLPHDDSKSAKKIDYPAVTASDRDVAPFCACRSGFERAR
ncbi:hypothetical protein [Hoeflea sp.]|uniref:hypothetical protein n=1 Tax=Hoeflea sp. TaxID=1940281 RepID=UPI003B02083B